MNFNRVEYLTYLYNSKNYLVEKESKFVQKTLTECETNKFLQNLKSLKGTIYKEGGKNPEEGLDCSGLIVYLFSKIGCKWFRDSSLLVNDISADKLYRYNVRKFYNISLLKPGDLIFFDSDKDNIIEHVSVFYNWDNGNNVWVWDASDYPDGKFVNKVSYRKINNLFDKNPLFGRPLKTIEAASLEDYFIFP
ncbi:NlpC/P60 family protein [Melioribacteraceae bacterium 4301-Me]|uniref:NlpC/P60 family protein n=1 Tax=Pyranulibacter aquaticus TaxID=3163344 RepID=UPI003598A516